MTTILAPRPDLAATEASLPAAQRAEQVYVWELPVRLVHWILAAAIVVLSATGFYLADPGLIPFRSADAFLFASVRFIHEVAAWVFTLAVLVRVYWAFAGNRYAHWRGLIPLTREQWRSLREMLRYYAFLRLAPPPEAGHNPLASLAYMGLYVTFLLQILTGFALYAWLLGTSPWTALFGWVYAIWPIQQVRWLHYVLTFVFFAFTIFHVYSSVLVDSLERNGLLSSIVTGYKFLVRGRPPVGAAPRGRPGAEGGA